MAKAEARAIAIAMGLSAAGCASGPPPPDEVCDHMDALAAQKGDAPKVSEMRKTCESTARALLIADASRYEAFAKCVTAMIDFDAAWHACAPRSMRGRY